jgi:hypothetical protein
MLKKGASCATPRGKTAPMAIQKIKEALPNTINPARRLPQNPSPAKPRLTSTLVISDYSPDDESGVATEYACF